MQHKTLIHKFWTRVLIGFIAGLGFRFPVDVILGLSYKNYVVDEFIAYYSLAILSSIILFLLFHLINLRFNRKYTWEKKVKPRFLIQLLSQLLIGIIFILTTRYLFNLLVFKTTFYVVKFEILNIVVIAFVIIMYNMIELGYYFLNSSRYSLAELERFKKENAEFRYETLMNQVNPHFLFNSLNTLSSLVYENQDIAAKYIRELARVYRYVLESKETDLVPLKVDLDFIKAYIYLLELRFKNMLNFEFSIDENSKAMLIAPMTIQMLVENAVKHNIISQKKHLEIKIYTEDSSLVVANNVQLKTTKGYSSGIGLNNIKSRYSYFTEKKIIIEEVNGKFSVKIPLIAKKDETYR